MPLITINGTDFPYDASEVITFPEGLIGLPEMRLAVLIAMNEFEPFYWLASVESEKPRFVVVDPNEIFADYNPAEVDRNSQTLAIVKVSSEWEKTTVNLRAPLIINTTTRTGAQAILNESNYQFAEAIVQN